MTSIITFILFLYGPSTIHTGEWLSVPVAEFDNRDDCQTIRDGLSGFKVEGSDYKLVCLESTASKTLTQ